MTLRRFSLLVLVWNLAVIVWGAFVRASRSGDGCGDHWPTCHGEVVPTSPSFKTLVEFSHRATSGLALIAVVVLFVWALRRLPKGDPARKAAGASLFFMLTEAAVGALLVLFKYVAGNDTLGRALFMAVHLVNTFLLVASLTLVVWHTAGGGRVRWRSGAGLLVGGVLGGLTLVGVSGAIAALGDTLFPAVNLLESLRSDFLPTAHLFIRLRVWHPVLAVTLSLAAGGAAVFLSQLRPTATVRRLAGLAGGLLVLQLGLGVTNVLLLAPVWLQLVHLLVADLVWIVFVLLGAAALEETAPVTTSAPLAST